MPVKFTHLHNHSHYSLLDGLPKIDDMLSHIKTLGMESLALTDHGNIYGAVEFYKKAKAASIKPIIGCEIYLAYEGMLDKRPNIDDKRYHLILLVKDQEGYKNLVKIITKAQLQGFYYKPRADIALLKQHSAGLIACSACIQGRIPRTIINGKIEEAAELTKQYIDIFGKENFFLEIQNHPNLQGQDLANKTLIDFASKMGLGLIATNDSHYLKPEDAKAQDVLMLINTGAKQDDLERLTMQGNDFSMPSAEKMAEFCQQQAVPEAMINTQKIVAMCNFDFEIGKIKLPYFKTPDSQPADECLTALCQKGLEEKVRQIENIQQAKERLEYELSVIKNTGFASYFLIVQDFVNWAKQNRIVVGPGRGSAAGSLVSFLLNITEVEPLKHGLLFERFLNPARVSMPDIDLDFADTRRDEVIKYVSEKYGKDHVAQIITFGTMAAKAVVRDVGRALQMPYSFCDQLAKMIPFGCNLEEAIDKVAEFRQMYNTNQDAKKLIDFAKELEGCARHASTHACGVVISAQPLDELVPLQFPSQTEQTIVTQYEMHAIDDLGLLKMDLLGLKNLTIIEDTLKRIYKVRNQIVDLASINLNDPKTLKVFQAAHTTGIFQLESSGIKRYLKELKPTSFEDVVSMIALYRPGPLQFIPEYIARKHHRKAIDYMHPKLEPILKNTYGVCVYQEQLMQIARDIAGFTLSEADVLRKAIGKKIPELLKAQKDKFIEGAIKNNVARQIAEKLWEWVLPFAQYGFNKSHSIAYGMIAFKTAFLKAYYPVEFMSALLTSERNDIERIAFLIDECKAMDIEVLPPDINESFHNFSVVPEQNKIRFGLLAVKNVGANIVSAIVEERKQNGAFKNFSDFASRIDCKDFNKKSLESLIKAGAFDQFTERNQLLENLEDILSFNREIRKAKTNLQASLFATVLTSAPALQLKEANPAENEQKLIWEKELLGLWVSSHPLEKVKNFLYQRAMTLRAMKEENFRQQVRVAGIISGIKKIVTKNGQNMLFVKLEDLTDSVEVVVFPSILENNPEVFQENKIVFVSGRQDTRGGELKIVASLVEEIQEV